MEQCWAYLALGADAVGCIHPHVLCDDLALLRELEVLGELRKGQRKLREARGGLYSRWRYWTACWNRPASSLSVQWVKFAVRAELPTMLTVFARFLEGCCGVSELRCALEGAREGITGDVRSGLRAEWLLGVSCAFNVVAGTPTATRPAE